MDANTVIVHPGGDVTLVLPPVSDTSAIPHPCQVQKGKINHLVVSSGKLTHLSPVFNTLLRGPFQEAQTLWSNGSLQLELDEDPVAMEIILGVLQDDPDWCFFRIDLTTLANVAVIFDKYQIYCYFAKEFRPYADDVWELAEEHFLDDEGAFLYEKSFVLFEWLSISWVFQLDVAFKECTNMLLLYFTPGGIQEILEEYERDGLLFPVPENVFDKIEKIRRLEISNMLSQAMLKVLVGVGRCTSECGPCDHRGRNCGELKRRSLVQSARTNGLYPLPEWPYQELEMSGVQQRLLSLDIDACPFSRVPAGLVGTETTFKQVFEDSLTSIVPTEIGFEDIWSSPPERLMNSGMSLRIRRNMVEVSLSPSCFSSRMDYKAPQDFHSFVSVHKE